MTGVSNIFLGIVVGLIGAITLTTPGGWDWLSATNLWMGGLLVGLGLATRMLR